MSRKRSLELVGLLVILGLTAYLRFVNLADNPGWYTDEATHINITQNLLQGRVQYLAITQSTLLFARPPLFHVLLSGWFRVFGEGMTALRMFTATLGVLTVGLLYWVVRRLQSDRVLPLLTALMLAIYPQVVLYSRFGFSYNLLPPLILLMIFNLTEYVENGRQSRLALATVLLGLGLVSDVIALTLVPILLLIVMIKRPRDGLWVVLLLLLPFGIYSAMMLASAPEAFLFDLRFTFTRLNTLSLFEQAKNLALNETILLSQDFWTLAGVIGLFLLRPTRLRNITLLFFWIPLVLVGRTVALYSLSAYYMIPFFPFIALGSAALLRYGVPFVAGTIGNELSELLKRWSGKKGARLATVGAYGIVLLIVVPPLMTSLSLTLEQVQTHMPTAIDPFLIRAEDARKTADYINSHARADEVIIASPAVGWQFKAQVADFQMSIAAEGEDTPHLPGNLPSDRWVFDPRLSTATWVVIDNLWRNWGAVHIPGVARMMTEIETNWQLIYESGEIKVYRR